ncbi:MAG: hypothetical protein OCU17_08590 [Methanophagales archaeon]|nr:hypothetical protein [Methanophagales archaeon]
MKKIKKVFEYSHLGDLGILKVRYPHIEQEIDEIIDSIKITGRTKISKEKNKIKAFKQIDFLKERILVEVQFGKYTFMFYDLAKFQYFYNKNQADVGIEIVPCYYLHKEMSTGVSYGEQLVYDIERLQRNFPSVPIKVIFIDV